MSATTTQRAQELLKSALVWDNHGCMPLRADDRFLPQLERYRMSGVTVASLNVGYADRSWAEHLAVLSFMRWWIARHPDRYSLVHTVDDVRRCKRERRLGIVFDVEGMSPVQDHVNMVQTFYELGVRWMLIAYNRNNAAGGGCLDVDTGLTALGRSIIDEMERVGMVLCLSHCGPNTAAEALEYARKPVIFSHSNPDGDTRHPRNVSDELMRSCARKGGVVGLSGIGAFLGNANRLTDALIRQLLYVAELVGADHVGLGLDFVFDPTELEEHLRKSPHLFASGTTTQGARRTVEPEALDAIVEGLLRAKLSDAEIRGILGENWLRIATSVWH